MNSPEVPFGVYIHWPFCSAKCPYCDFNSHVRRAVNHDHWRKAFAIDIKNQRRRSGPQKVKSVFFGGGTPSLMEPDTVRSVLEDINRAWGLEPNAEVTLEANPTSVEAEKFKAFGHAGVTRISMGIQSLRDDDLKTLGRMHTAKEARTAFSIARDIFKHVSFDLIYARPDQSSQMWADELGEALEMAVDHLSLYQLTIERGTRFWDLRAKGGLKGLPDHVLGADLFEITQKTCAAAGLPAYEISNHARPGAESQHNLLYWRYGYYAGIGPGAHGRLPGKKDARFATETAHSPEKWLSDVEENGSGILSATSLSPEEQQTEILLMGLRLREGVSLERITTPLDTGKMQNLVKDGFIWQEKNRIGTTDAGRPVLNAIIAEILS